MDRVFSNIIENIMEVYKFAIVAGDLANLQIVLNKVHYNDKILNPKKKWCFDVDGANS